MYLLRATIIHNATRLRNVYECNGSLQATNCSPAPSTHLSVDLTHSLLLLTPNFLGFSLVITQPCPERVRSVSDNKLFWNIKSQWKNHLTSWCRRVLSKGTQAGTLWTSTSWPATRMSALSTHSRRATLACVSSASCKFMARLLQWPETRPRGSLWRVVLLRLREISAR